MNYTLIDENGANSIELEIIIPVKSFFLHQFGLYKVTHYSENQIFCERILNYQFYEFYNELLEKYPALRELIYFEWKNVETAIICFDFNVI